MNDRPKPTGSGIGLTLQETLDQGARGARPKPPARPREKSKRKKPKEPETRKITVRIPVALHDRLRMEAAIRYCHLQEAIAALLERPLRKWKAGNDDLRAVVPTSRRPEGDDALPEPERRKITVRLPAETHRLLRLDAAATRSSVQDALSERLAEELDRLAAGK